MFMCFGIQTVVINLDLTWKQSFLIQARMFYWIGP
jgi:hypothetical protein